MKSSLHDLNFCADDFQKQAIFPLSAIWIVTFSIPILLKLGVYGKFAMSIFLTLSILFLLASYLISYKHMEVVP